MYMIFRYTFFNSASPNVAVKVFIRHFEKGDLNDTTKGDVEMCIWNSLSYTLAGVDPENGRDRLSNNEKLIVFNFLMAFRTSYSGCTVKSVGIKPLALNLKCVATISLDKLAKHTKSGHLAKLMEDYLSKLLAIKMGISEMWLETEISAHEYKLCMRTLGKEGRQSLTEIVG